MLCVCMLHACMPPSHNTANSSTCLPVAMAHALPCHCHLPAWQVPQGVGKEGEQGTPTPPPTCLPYTHTGKGRRKGRKGKQNKTLGQLIMEECGREEGRKKEGRVGGPGGGTVVGPCFGMHCCMPPSCCLSCLPLSTMVPFALSPAPCSSNTPPLPLLPTPLPHAYFACHQPRLDTPLPCLLALFWGIWAWWLAGLEWRWWVGDRQADTGHTLQKHGPLLPAAQPIWPPS